MPRLFMYPYNRFSKGAKDLKNSLGVKFLRLEQERSRVRFRPNDRVINWGSARCWVPDEFLWNKPSAINKASNKLLFFASAAETDTFKTPLYTTNVDDTKDWEICVARTNLRGTKGDGIVITEKGQEPPEAELYTRYIRKDSEFRIHVAFGEVVDWARKIRRPGAEVKDWKVRSLDNGFIFARKSGAPNIQTQTAAVRAVEHFNLDFGAVDVIVTKRGNPYVLEINSAPALIGTTLEKYNAAFTQRYNADNAA